ncbi:SDR family oxidoreductase [Mycolicibacterium hodleri]|uniref:SDR family oxidoreductase n=1 Tax=Mycolicibacterium hodleri TaxID=49897 RepID=UPI00195F8A59|nr:SDR family oxidoreductase [Mycolicibacterium hodleri]
MTGPLKDKIAIVTGSSRGIGRAIAERLGKDGATVVLTYYENARQAEEAARVIGNQSVAEQVDIRDLASARELLRKVIDRFGRIDILVNNAAGTNVFKPTELMTEEEYDSMFLITRGVYFTLQEAARHMADNGRIVSISTGGTTMAIPTGGAYAGSKAAIEQFSNGLAKEIGRRGITVNTLSPGVTATDGMVLDDEQATALVAQTALGRLGQPGDIAAAVALLVSDDAHWITGQNIRATGGIV